MVGDHNLSCRANRAGQNVHLIDSAENLALAILVAAAVTKASPRLVRDSRGAVGSRAATLG